MEAYTRDITVVRYAREDMKTSGIAENSQEFVIAPFETSLCEFLRND